MGGLLLLSYFVLPSQNLRECCAPLSQQGLNKYSWTNSLNNHMVGSHLLLKSMSLVLVRDVHPSANILALGINRPICSAPASWLRLTCVADLSLIFILLWLTTGILLSSFHLPCSSTTLSSGWSTVCLCLCLCLCLCGLQRGASVSCSGSVKVVLARSTLSGCPLYGRS